MEKKRMNKKILLSFLLVVLIALSASAVSAENTTDVVAAADATDAVAVDNDADELAADVTTEGQTADAIQNAVNTAKAGDTVKLNGEYIINDSSITIQEKDGLTIDGQGSTTIYGYGDGNGFFYVTNSKAVTIKGITFIDNNPKNNLTYGGSVNGWGVYFNGNDAAGGVVDNCTFTDFNQAVVVKSCNNVTVKNSKFYGGYATKLVNDPTVNKEQGSKVIAVGGSFFTTIEDNLFDGVVLDAISIAQASGDARIIGNTFKDNVYSIFFGGASTDGTFISNNIFENCGYFNGTFDGQPVYWDAYPVVSIQKASSGVFIDNNTFKAITNNWLIAAEQGNTAHGYPSTLGNINVTNNKIVKYNKDEDISGVTLLHILCRAGLLNPYDDIAVTGNEFVDGVTPIVVWANDWGSEDKTPSDIVIPAADPVQTQIAITSVVANKVTAVLKDINGKAIASEKVTATIAGNTTDLETDENGAVTIDAVAGENVAFAFAATKAYAASEANIDVPAAAKLIATTIATNDVSIKALNAAKVSIALKDETGAALANKTVAILIDGETAGVVQTDANGTVTFTTQKYSAAGTHSVVAYYAGDNTTSSSIDTATIKVTKSATTLTAAKATLKVKKAKKVKVTLKSGSKLIANKKITIKVNGKTFSAKTNSKGVATISVKVAKKGTFTAVVNFAGDSAYNAKTVKVKYTVKK